MKTSPFSQNWFIESSFLNGCTDSGCIKIKIFPDQLQIFIERYIWPQGFQMGKNFSSFKLANQVASYTQSANSSTLWTTLPGCHWLTV